MKYKKRKGCQNPEVVQEHHLAFFFSMFHRAFFNSIIDKTPTHALFIQHYISLAQRFSNFFQVGTTFFTQNVLRTTFISQNVLRTTLLLGLSNSLGLP